MLLVSGCNSSLVPSGYRNNIHDLPYLISGNWTDVKIKSPGTSSEEIKVSGELIAIQSDTLYLLTTMMLECIYIPDIIESNLRIYSGNPGTYALITGLLYLPDVIAAAANGQAAFLALGLPGLIVGTIVTVNAANNSDILKYPYENNLKDLSDYARFPQGMPPGIERSKLHLVSRYK